MEISVNSPQKISRNLFQSFGKFVKEFLFPFIRFNDNHIKINNEQVFDKQLSKSLCFNFMH